jgi:hypothetical protein
MVMEGKSIKDAKAHEFPMKPSKADKARDVPTKVKAEASKKKLSKMDRLMAMLDSDTDE